MTPVEGARSHMPTALTHRHAIPVPWTQVTGVHTTPCALSHNERTPGPRLPYVSPVGPACLSPGGSLHHGVAADTVHVLMGSEDLGNHLCDFILWEGVVCPRHICLQGAGNP